MTRTSTDPRPRRRAVRARLAAAALAALLAPAAGRQGDVSLLKLLGVTAAPESLDYVTAKTQFQLHMLLTEQRHPKTWSLGERIASDTEAGLRMLFAVDEDDLCKPFGRRELCVREKLLRVRMGAESVDGLYPAFHRVLDAEDAHHRVAVHQLSRQGVFCREPDKEDKGFRVFNAVPQVMENAAAFAHT